MDYYTAMEEAMVQAAEDSFLPTELTREQMLTRIDDITGMLKKSGVRSSERILLHAERHAMRLRLLRAEQVAQRLLGGVFFAFVCPKCGHSTKYRHDAPAGSIRCAQCKHAPTT